MHLRLLALFSIIYLTGSIAGAAELNISFYGTPPTFPSGKLLNVIDGVNPDIPVVFDLSKPNCVVLRPTTQEETLTTTQPLFKFEWQGDNSARFYRLTPSTLLAELSAANALDTQTSEGKTFEQKVLQQYFSEGEVLRACLPASKPFRGLLSFFIVVTSSGKLDKAVVQPEGAVAECILERAKEVTFDAPPTGRSFTAKTDVHVTE